MRVLIPIALFACACLALGTPTVRAEPRALLIGVGVYEKADWNLPGTDVDLANMHDMAQLMGFKPQQIRTLRDSQATHARVTREMSTWLHDGVKPDDRVLIYFTGHGTRVPDTNNDEADGADDTLMLHDSRFTRRGTNGLTFMANSLIDDEIGELLDRIPSKRVMLLVDACHSGTITRDVDFEQFSLGEKAGVRKFVYYEGMPKAAIAKPVAKSARVDKFVALSATDDTQSAISTHQGSVFTLGVVSSLRAAAQAGRDISLEEVRKEVSDFIDKRLQPSLRFTPMISGNVSLAEGGLSVAALQNSDGPMWRELQALASHGDRLILKPGKSRYAIGEDVRLAVTIPKAGYLNIVTVDANDSATVLFPNKFHGDNKVKAGKFDFPGPELPFSLPAIEPSGRALVVGFLSQHPVNLMALGIEGRDNSGQMDAAFTQPTKLGTQSLGAAANQAPFSAGLIEVVIAQKGL